MKKLQLKIPVLLPQVPNEKDTCVQRLIEELEAKEGLDKVHIKDDQEDTVPQLCFHYDPDIISIDRIQSLAERTGAEITEKYGHFLIEVEGIRHTRHARIIEKSLLNTNGVLEASANAGGMIRLEYDKRETSFDEITTKLEKESLQVKKSSSGHENGFKSSEKTSDKLNKENEMSQEHQHEDEDELNHKEADSHGAGEEHSHAHGGIFGKNTELIFAITCGVLLGIGFGLSFVESVPQWVSLSLYIGAYFFGGFYTAKEAVETVAKGGFEIDFLMLVAAIGAAILGEWAEGALLLFLFSLGHALEHYAMNKARKSIAALAELAPKTALVKKNGKTEEVGIEKLTIGDIIVVKPNSKISADGVVVDGQSSVNQAPITGESVPVDKVPVENVEQDYSEVDDIKDENRVFAGTINGNNTLEIKVIKAAKDSTLSRLVKLVNEAQTQKSPTQLLTDKFEKYFVPSVLILVGILLFAFFVIDEPFSASFYRAMAVLVAASPCALAISTPSAVLSGVARAARGGVLIKGGRPLEDLGELTALAFDKTGTLTEGKPKLTQVIPLGDISENELLKIAVAVESLSDHPLAKAVVRDGKERLEGEEIPDASNLEAVLGKGIKATLGNDKIYVGNLDLYEELNDTIPSEEITTKVRDLEGGGNTTMLLRKNGEYIGILALMDTPREAAKRTLSELKEIGIKRMIMLTGDNQKVADAVAEEIGLTDAWGSLLPEEKVEAIKKLKKKESKVAMVGDGVNDAPAMANSTVGIAMGAAGSDVALETADIALMADKLETLPFAIGLSRKAKAIIKQNLWVSLGIVALLIPATIFGFANIGVAVVIHEGSTLLVVFNALRLLAYKKMNKSTFIINQMDCPSEEQMIRMKLESYEQIKYLDFDIPNRKLEVYHQEGIEDIHSSISELKLGDKFIRSEKAEVPVGEDETKQKISFGGYWVLILVFFLIEMTTGWISSSMGLIADSLDMLADSIVYALSLFAVGGAVSRKKKVAKFSGYFQMFLATLGFVEVLRRFLMSSETPLFQWMIIISSLALAGNLISLWLINKAKSKEAHMQASAIFTSNDIIVNGGVILAGILVYFLKSKWPDLIIGGIVFTFVMRGAIKILKISK